MSRVYLAVGHGIRPDGKFDPGAVSGRHTEQSSGDVIVEEATAVLRAAGVTVREEAYDDDPNYVGTVEAANRWGADVVVSVHHDWTGGVDAAFGFWYPGSSKGEKLTRNIVEAVGEAGWPTSSSWTKARGDLYLLKNTKAPTSLIECGRIGDETLDTPEELKGMGRAIARGIADYLGVRVGADLPAPVAAERAVAVYGARRPDFELAVALGAAHGFAVVDRDGDGWVQVHESGQRTPVSSVGYLVGVGGPSRDAVAQVGDGVVLAGSDGHGTAVLVGRRAADRDVPRRRPWAT